MIDLAGAKGDDIIARVAERAARAAAAVQAMAAAPRGGKVFLGLSAMERRVAQIEQRLAAIQERAEPLVDAVQAGEAEDAAGLMAALRRLQREAAEAVAARDEMIEEIHAEQA